MNKPHLRSAGLTALLAVLLVLGGCVVAPAPYRAGYGPSYGPPPPRAEVIGVAPISGQIWISGFWDWADNRYEWQPGHWEAPRPGYRWEPHRWDRDGDRWQQHGGRWERDDRRKDGDDRYRR